MHYDEDQEQARWVEPERSGFRYGSFIQFGSIWVELPPAPEPQPAVDEHDGEDEKSDDRLGEWLFDQVLRVDGEHEEVRNGEVTASVSPAQSVLTDTLDSTQLPRPAEEQDAIVPNTQQLVENDVDATVAPTFLQTDEVEGTMEPKQPSQLAGDEDNIRHVLPYPAHELADPQLEGKERRDTAGPHDQKLGGKGAKKNKRKGKSQSTLLMEETRFKTIANAYAAPPGRPKAKANTSLDVQASTESVSQIDEAPEPQPSERGPPSNFDDVLPRQTGLDKLVQKKHRRGGKKSSNARKQTGGGKATPGLSNSPAPHLLLTEHHAASNQPASTTSDPDVPGEPQEPTPQPLLTRPSGAKNQDLPDHFASEAPAMLKTELPTAPAGRALNMGMQDGQIDRSADAASLLPPEINSQAQPEDINLAKDPTGFPQKGNIVVKQLDPELAVSTASNHQSSPKNTPARPVLGADRGWGRTLPPLERTTALQPDKSRSADESPSPMSNSESPSSEADSESFSKVHSSESAHSSHAGGSLDSDTNLTEEILSQPVRTRLESYINDVHKSDRRPLLATCPPLQYAATRRVLRWNNVRTPGPQASQPRIVDRDSRWRRLKSSSLIGIKTVMQRGELTDTSMFGPVLDGELTLYPEKKALPIPVSPDLKVWLPIRQVGYRTYQWQSHLGQMTIDEYEICKHWERIAGRYSPRKAVPPDQSGHQKLLNTQAQLDPIGKCIAHFAANPG